MNQQNIFPLHIFKYDDSILDLSISNTFEAWIHVPAKLVILAKRDLSSPGAEIIEAYKVCEYDKFSKCSSVIEEIHMDREIKLIKDNFFEDFTNLQDVGTASFSQLETIGENAFKDCIQLERVVLPSGVDIAANAFQNCIALSSIEFFDGDDKTNEISIKNFPWGAPNLLIDNVKFL